MRSVRYTNGKKGFALTKATQGPEKADNLRRGEPKSEQVDWSPETFLEEHNDILIGYSHIAGHDEVRSQAQPVLRSKEPLVKKKVEMLQFKRHRRVDLSHFGGAIVTVNPFLFILVQCEMSGNYVCAFQEFRCM